MNAEYREPVDPAEPADAVTQPTGQGTPAPTRPRTGPIVWGSLILVCCAYLAQRTIAPESVDTITWAIASVVGLGLLLLVVGIVVIVRGTRRSGR